MNFRTSIIIPVFNDADILMNTLSRLQSARGSGHEVIVVDGSSGEFPLAQISRFADVLIDSQRGRAMQMNAGAEIASGEVLIFLHADTILPEMDVFLPLIRCRLELNRCCWGFFRAHLSGSGYMFRVIEATMNLRSKLSHIATGDQAIFVSRELFEQVGGYSSIPLMEDIELCKKLGSVIQPLCLDSYVLTSSRRWEQHGIFKTIFLMWCYRLAYFLGMKPERLARYYYG